MLVGITHIVGMHYTPSLPQFTTMYGHFSVNTMPLNMGALTIQQGDLIVTTAKFFQRCVPFWDSKEDWVDHPPNLKVYYGFILLFGVNVDIFKR